LTDTATADGLGQFEGRDVLSTGIEMPGAGGGLNKALAIDNLSLHIGDAGTLVIEYEVGKVRHDPIKDTEGVQRVHVLRVTMAAQIDPDAVAEALEQQRIRVEESMGVKRLPLGVAADPDAPDDAPED